MAADLCAYILFYTRLLSCTEALLFLWRHLKVNKQLNLQPEKHISLCDEKGDVDRARPWEIIPAGHKIGSPNPLFKELVFDILTTIC